ncbi:MAG: DUF72 domain-containing protein [Bacteroidales bacterium]
MKWYIGTSGWSYKDWKETFYPADLNDKNKRLQFYAEHFNCTEVNSTFYNIPPEETVRNWHESVPVNFQFVIKLNRYFSHLKRLKSDNAVSQKLEEFSHIPELLGDKLGPFLVQLPGSMKKDAQRLREWLEFMPKYRYAFEFRNEQWFDEDIFEILKEYDAALVYSHSTEFPTDLKCTASFMYLRFHGPDKPYYSKYSREQLENEYEKIRLFLNDCREIYTFFNNTYKAYAIENARLWKELTGQN